MPLAELKSFAFDETVRTSAANAPTREGQKSTRRLTALIEREGASYVALCPELDIASQGTSVEDARRNLSEALELFFEEASPDEIAARSADEV